MKSFRSWLLSFCMFLSLSVTAIAAPEPVLTAISQPKLMRGQSVTLTIAGNHLLETSRIILDGPPGVAAQLVASDKPVANSIALQVTIDASATLGDRELRLVTPGGVSNKLDLEITFLPVALEKEPNNTLDTAQVVTLPATLNGVINGGADIDAFQFTAKKGQHLIFESFAQRGGSALDTTLKLYDPSGREVERSEDAIGTDSLIAYEVAADGPHTLIVHDVQYRGGGNYTYRINAGAIPYAKAIFPMGGKRGTVFDAQLTGWNLPSTTLRVDLTDKPVGRTSIFATPDGASNPLAISVSESDELSETENNNALAGANVIPSLPVVVNGVIAQHGDLDLFRFKVEKPMKLSFAVEAMKLGSRLDALLTLHDAKGNIIVRSDDAAPGSDAALVRDLSPGEYHIVVTDLTSLGGSDYGYRLTIAPPKPVSPDFSVRFFPDTIRLHRGGRTVVQCEVFRTGGFNGDVTVALKNAPPGVSAQPLVIDNGPVSGLFVIEAAADADMRIASLELIATGKQGDQVIERTAQPLAMVEPVKGAYLAVQSASPFTIDQPKPLTDEQVQAVVAQIQAIEKQMLAPHAEADKAMIAWEQAAVADAKVKAEILVLLKVPAEKRSEAQRSQLLSYYREQSPLLAPQRAEVASLRARIGVREELARLRARLSAEIPGLAVAQAQWEKDATSDTWSTLEFAEMKSVGGARFTRDKDGSILLSAANPPKDTYTLTAPVSSTKITAIRLEALADAKLKAGGPGRAENGNFVLTQFNITIAPAIAPAKQQKVELHSPKATFEQDGWPVANTLDGNDSTGWAVSPQFGQNHTAIFMVKPIAGIEGDAIITITMRNESPHVQHTLGNFRIATTSAAKPAIDQPSLPGNIVKLLAVPADKRNAKQQGELAAYYRSVAPLLEADRQKLAALEATQNAGNPSMKYNQTSTVAFEVKRAPGFTGDIVVTALGYAAGRDAKGTANIISKDIIVTPLTLKGDQTIGTITLKAKDKSEMGTRTIVLEAQAKIDGDTVTQVSEAIPVSITK